MSRPSSPRAISLNSIPARLLAECREKAGLAAEERPAAVFVVAVWLALAAPAIHLVARTT
ncbi:MAG TPA: hypothetical protein VK869_03055 [Rubrobacteraceae bacterium]|nr:hypothetical protein [Rubrobacteraceae bacterium]